MSDTFQHYEANGFYYCRLLSNPPFQGAQGGADMSDYDTQRAERRLQDAYDRINVMETELETVGGMTIVVYVLFIAGGIGIGWFLRGWWM